MSVFMRAFFWVLFLGYVFVGQAQSPMVDSNGTKDKLLPHRPLLWMLLRAIGVIKLK